MKKQKAIIALTVLIDVLGIAIVIPILPFYMKSFGASPIVITSIFTIFSFFSFFSAPLLGSLSDKIGRRPVLIISILSTSIGWVVFALANSIPVLFLGRIIDGIAAGNFSTAQSYLIDISKDEKERTANLGIIGAVFGLGFIIGPILGSFLSKISLSAPFWFVGGLAFLNAVLAFFILPETNKSANKEKNFNFNPFMPLIRAIKNKMLLPSYLSWFFFGMAAISMQSIFALYIAKIFGFSHIEAGIILAFVGGLIVINQGFGLKMFWLKKFKESNLGLWMILIYSVGFIFLSARHLIMFSAGIILGALGESVLRVILTSLIAGRSESEQRGEVVGILSSIMSVATVISPIIAGLLFVINASLPFVFGAVISLISFLIAYSNRKRFRSADSIKNSPVELNI